MAKIVLPAQNISIQKPHGEIDPIWYEKLKGWEAFINLASNYIPPVSIVSPPLHASLGADVLLNNIGNYFPGPSIAQGTTGTWFVSGTVTVIDTAAGARINAKLWDGTAIIASAQANVSAASGTVVIALSGFIASPAGNLLISCNDATSTSGKILFNQSGNSRDSTISAFRIA